MRATIRNDVRCISPPEGRETVAALPLVTFGGNPFQDGPRARRVPLGKPWDRQPISGKLRRKLASVPGLQRQAQAGHAAWAVGSILQRQGAAVTLGDLAAEHQADAAAAGLGGEERNKQVRRII